MANEAKKLLVEARKLISNERCWTQKATAKKLAYDGYLEATIATDPDACQWCASGAVEKVFASWNSPYSGFRKQAISALSMASSGHRSIIGLNDCCHTTHDQVLAVFDKAIAKLS